jgi:pimeloyl-ACP methyl ester carboxylesterase
MEGMTDVESDRRARETGPFGDLPLTVIMAGNSNFFSHLPPEEMEAAEAKAEAEHRALADLSTNGRFLIAEGSGHNVPVDDPEIIVAAVREMVNDRQ